MCGVISGCGDESFRCVMVTEECGEAYRKACDVDECGDEMNRGDALTDV